MIVSSQTAVLPRRIAASAIDLALVGLLWLLVLYRLAVRFEIAQREPDGTPIYSELQLQQLSEIREGLNRGQILGDFYYSLHGRGLVLGLISLLIFSLIAWVLVPANTGWSVGHRALGLMVTDMKGDKPPLDSYLRRYLVGLVDLFPYVIPGLLGWIVASRNENHQRMGDLSAGTVVIDVNTAAVAAPEMTTTVIRPSSVDDEVEPDVELVLPSAPPPPADPKAMVDLEEALSGHVEAAPSAEADYPVLDLEDTSVIPTTGADVVADVSGSDFVNSITEHEEKVLDSGELPEVSYADNWHFPESQEAPVWTPEPTTNNGPKPAEVESADSPAVDATPAEAAHTADMGDPVWNEEWSAWLYWDGEGNQWLRHDSDQGWVPIGDSQKA